MALDHKMLLDLAEDEVRTMDPREVELFQSVIASIVPSADGTVSVEEMAKIYTAATVNRGVYKVPEGSTQKEARVGHSLGSFGMQYLQVLLPQNTTEY